MLHGGAKFAWCAQLGGGRKNKRRQEESNLRPNWGFVAWCGSSAGRRLAGVPQVASRSPPPRTHSMPGARGSDTGHKALCPVSNARRSSVRSLAGDARKPGDAAHRSAQPQMPEHARVPSERHCHHRMVYTHHKPPGLLSSAQIAMGGLAIGTRDDLFETRPKSAKCIPAPVAATRGSRQHPRARRRRREASKKEEEQQHQQRQPAQGAEGADSWLVQQQREATVAARGR